MAQDVLIKVEGFRVADGEVEEDDLTILVSELARRIRLELVEVLRLGVYAAGTVTVEIGDQCETSAR